MSVSRVFEEAGMFQEVFCFCFYSKYSTDFDGMGPDLPEQMRALNCTYLVNISPAYLCLSLFVCF